jgi:pyruvate dehydrogenase E2 component (dihydrolipoamide acetyltransferase)
MGTPFSLPDLGEGLQEAEIIAWHVGVGDHVVRDQPLVTVETDKALVDVPSPLSGHIESLGAEPGEIVSVGQTLVEFTEGESADTGTVVGEVPAPEDVPPAPAPVAAGGVERPARVAASPAVRRLASSLGVDLDEVNGTGAAGSVTRADVETAAAGLASGRKGAKALPGERLRGVRRAMFLTMARAGREVVPATVTDEADIDAWPEGEDVTVRLIIAMVNGCRACPTLNAGFDASTETLSVHERIDLGVAIETDEGLFAPVIADAGGRDLADLRQEIEALKGAVDARSLPRERLVGQTITLSNFGMFGGRFAELVVVPPQVAILGAGRVERRPVAIEDRVAVHRVLPLSLSFDHRVVTGVEATRFLAAVIEDLERHD